MNNKKYIVYLSSALDTRYVSFRNYLEKSRHFMKLGGVYLATNRPEAMSRRKVGSL